MSSVPTPLPFSETFAHPDDPLPEHLERVAERAAASIAPTARAGIRELAFVVGLFHDLGKATPWFQDYLLQPRPALGAQPSRREWRGAGLVVHR